MIEEVFDLTDGGCRRASTDFALGSRLMANPILGERLDDRGIYNPFDVSAGRVVRTETLALDRVQRLFEEPLPRPAAQRAFAVPLEPEEDLDTVSWVSAEEIAITPELSARYFDMFEGGEALFPDEPFDMHIDRIRRLRTYRPEALEAALSRRMLPLHSGGIAGAMEELTAAGYYACSSEVVASRQSVEASFADWDARRQNLMSRLRLRGVAAHFQG